MDVFLYSVPYDSGHFRERMGTGPDGLLKAGLQERLAADGHKVMIRELRAPEEFVTEIGTSFALYRQLAEKIQADCADGAFPVVLSGNCGAALGAINGLRAGPEVGLGTAWFDAHGDFNTPDTSPSGFLDGMCLATATGLGWQGPAAGIPGFQPLRADQILHIGGRDFDPLEIGLLDQFAIRRIHPGEIQSLGLMETLEPAAAALSEQASQFYLHLDADVLDPLETPANHFPAPGGLLPDQIFQSVKLLAGRIPLRGMGIASYDPAWDPRGNTAAALVDIAAACAGLVRH